MYRFFLLFSIALFFYVDISAHEDISNRCANFESDGSCSIYYVGLRQLLAIPNAFDGKNIRVQGVVNFDAHGAYLSLFQQDYKNLDLSSQIIIHMTEAQSEKFKQLKSFYALIYGQFSVEQAQGRVASYIGYIEANEINRFVRSGTTTPF